MERGGTNYGRGRGGRGGGHDGGRGGGRNGGRNGGAGYGRGGGGDGYRPQFQQPPPQQQHSRPQQVQQLRPPPIQPHQQQQQQYQQQPRPQQQQQYQQQPRPQVQQPPQQQQQGVGRTGPAWRPAAVGTGGPVSYAAKLQPPQQSRVGPAISTAGVGGAANRGPVNYAAKLQPPQDSRVAHAVTASAVGGAVNRGPVNYVAPSQAPPIPAGGRIVHKTPEGTGESPRSGELVPIGRPDKGGLQRRRMVNILVNHFPVDFNPETVIRHYDIDVTRNEVSARAMATRFSKSTLSEIKDKLFAENPSFPLEMTAYDGEKNVFSAVPLPTGKYTVQLSQEEDRKGRSYTISVTLVKELKLHSLRRYFSKEVLQEPRDVLQAMDVVMKENQRRNMVSIGRMFHPVNPEKNIGQGMAASFGALHSLRSTSQGLAMCLDYSVLAVRKKLPVIDFLQEHVRGFNVGSFQRFRRQVESALKGLKVTVTHRRTNQKYIIAGLTDKRTSDITFTAEDRDGLIAPKSVRLLDYFKEKYPLANIKHKDLPCLNLGKNGKMNYVPMEFCVLLEGQRYPKDDLDRDAGVLLKSLSLVSPNERRSKICGMLQDVNGPCGGEIIRQFDIDVQRNMTRVQGRVMEPPQVKLRPPSGGNSTGVRMDNDSCQWNLTQNSVVEGTSVTRWAVIDFSSQERDDRLYREFIYALVDRCNKLGLRMEEPLLIEDASMRDFANADSLTRRLESVYHKECEGNLQFLLCVMSRKDPGYKHLKWVSEIKIGIITQCCISKMANKGQDQYLANLGMKINAKLGGSNVDLVAPLPLFADCSRVMLIGADVNHPRAADLSSPSIAALVASTNARVATKYIEKLSFQKHRSEKILGFGKLCMELIDSYEKINGVKPQKLVIFRDGVSEGQFLMVLNDELVDLKKELEARDYYPSITLIVARKRHHTRLFPETPRDASKKGNILPGTVVDTTIVHPFEFDFYLCSHYGSIGTSKPTHYSVLWDENNFTSDKLQRLVYDLCFTYAKCCKPVSLIPPVYYADLLAYRGRLYYDALTESQSSSRNSSTSWASSSSSSTSGASINESLYSVHSAIKNAMYYI